MYWQKMSERTSETIRQLRKKQMRKCQMRHFTYVYLFVFLFYACILILVLFFILGKQYKKKDEYIQEKSTKKNLNIFESVKRGDISAWTWQLTLFVQFFSTRFDTSKDRVSSQPLKLNWQTSIYCKICCKNYTAQKDST